jgi:hypothetical protein
MSQSNPTPSQFVESLLNKPIGDQAADRFFKAAMKDRTHALPEQAEKLLHAMGADPRFSLAEPAVVQAEIMHLVRNNSVPSDISKGLEHMHQRVGISDIEIDRPLPNVDKPTSVTRGAIGSDAAKLGKPTSLVSQVTTQWNGLPTEGKANVAMGALAAMVAAHASVSNFRRSLRRDEAGNRHIDSVGLATSILLALLAAGSAGLAVAYLRTGTAR